MLEVIKTGGPEVVCVIFVTLANNRSLGDFWYFQPCRYFVLEQMIVRL